MAGADLPGGYLAVHDALAEPFWGDVGDFGGDVDGYEVLGDAQFGDDGGEIGVGEAVGEAAKLVELGDGDVGGGVGLAGHGSRVSREEKKRSVVKIS